MDNPYKDSPYVDATDTYCYSHGRNESREHSIEQIVCPECNHVFLSGRELVTIHNSYRSAHYVTNPEEVFACPYCHHDF